ncbi:MAG: nickel-binding protein [Pseudomonadota bacterium]
MKLTDVYVECRVASGALPANLNAATCVLLHRVQWLRTVESQHSDRLLCHFRAPDAESVRNVLRRLNVDVDAVWTDRRRENPERSAPRHVYLP